MALTIVELSSKQLATPRISVQSLQAGTNDNPIRIASRNIFLLVFANRKLLWPHVADSKQCDETEEYYKNWVEKTYVKLTTMKILVVCWR